MTAQVAVPSMMVITDRRAAAHAGHDLVDVVAACLDAGAPAVLLRDKDLSVPDRWALGHRLQPLVAAAGARLLVSSDPALARRLGADGVHLAAADPPCPRVLGLTGRSCHDEDEIARAVEEGVAYAFVSPVASTPSKPGHGPPLGGTGLHALVTTAGTMPLLALGGVTPSNAPTWRAAGAHGVAVMGGVMAATDPGNHLRALLRSWASGSDGSTHPTDCSETA